MRVGQERIVEIYKNIKKELLYWMTSLLTSPFTRVVYSTAIIDHFQPN
jgi:hypothetical protein